MNSIKMNLMFWLSGVVAGVLLMERWRRSGANAVPLADDLAEAGGPAAAGAASVPGGKPKFLASIVSGAKADVERVRVRLTRATP